MKKTIGFATALISVLVSGCAGLIEGGGGPTYVDHRVPGFARYNGIPSNINAAGVYEVRVAKADAFRAVGYATGRYVDGIWQNSNFTGMNAAQSWAAIIAMANGGVPTTNGRVAVDPGKKAREWRKETLKACRKTGKSLDECRVIANAEEASQKEATPAVNAAPAEAPRPAATPPAPTSSGQVAPAAPIEPPVFAPSPAAAPVGEDHFLQFKTGVINAQDPNQMAAAFGTAASHARTDEARIYFEGWAKGVQGKNQKEFVSTKEQLVRGVDGFQPFIK